MMKRRILAIFALCSLSTEVYATFTSKTIFVPQPTTMDLPKIFSLSTYRFFHGDYDEKLYDRPQTRSMFNYQTTWFYEENRDYQDFSRYLLFNDKDTISFAQSGCGDVASNNFNLELEDGEFWSSMTTYPIRRLWGNIIRLIFDIDCILPRAFLSLIMPIMRVEYDLGFKDLNRRSQGVGEDSSGQTIRNITEAFQSADIVNAIFQVDEFSDYGLDDMQVSAGVHIIDDGVNNLALLGQVLVPMGSKPDTRLLLSPFTGNGGHLGIGASLIGDAKLFCHKRFSVDILGQIKYRYLFSTTWRRTFDLKNGPWSRYLKVSTENFPSISQSGVNVLTRDVRVQPGQSYALLGALNVRYSTLVVEAGCSYYYRGKEKLNLKKPYDAQREGVGIFDPRTTNPTTRSRATISTPYTANGAVTPDKKYTLIEQSDINLLSGRQEKMILTSLFGSIGWMSTFLGLPSMFGIGGSFTHSGSNVGRKKWSVWMKSHLSF